MVRGPSKDAGFRVGPLSDPPARRIAFVELWRIGDAIAATAGLAALATTRPEAQIAIVAHPEFGDPLFRLLPNAVHIPFPAFWTRGKLPRDKYLPWTIDYGALARVRRALRRFAPQTYLLFRGDVREQLFFSGVYGAPMVDFRNPLRLPWVQQVSRPSRVPRYQEHLALVGAWTGSAVVREPMLAGVPAHDRSGSYVLIHPGGSWRFKQWSADKLAAVIRALQAARVPVKLIGGEVDRPMIARIQDRLSERVDTLFPALSDFYAAVAQARVVICNNSAALHIAEALGTPCVSITGPNDPVRWGTYRGHSHTLERSVGLPCHPCAEKHCVRPDHPCIEDVQVDDVLQALVSYGIHTHRPAPALGPAESDPQRVTT